MTRHATNRHARTPWIAAAIGASTGVALALGITWYEVLGAWTALGFCALVVWALGGGE